MGKLVLLEERQPCVGRGGKPGLSGHTDLGALLSSVPFPSALQPRLSPQRRQVAIFLPCGQPPWPDEWPRLSPLGCVKCQVAFRTFELSLPQGQVPGSLLNSSPARGPVAMWTEQRCSGQDMSGLPGPTAAQLGPLANFSESRSLACNVGTDTARHVPRGSDAARAARAHLVEPLHDHVGQVLVQHGGRDDHLVEGLVVAPNGEVRGLLLLAAAAGHGGQRAAEGGWQPGLGPQALAPLCPDSTGMGKPLPECGGPLPSLASRTASLGSWLLPHPQPPAPLLAQPGTEAGKS